MKNSLTQHTVAALLGGLLVAASMPAQIPRLIADINDRPLNISSYPSEFTTVVVGGRRLAFFRATESGTGGELYVSDGTPAGTSLVGDLLPGPAGSGPKELTAVGDRLFFIANINQLWVCEPDAASGLFPTRKVADIGNNVSALAAAGDRFYFRKSVAPSQHELWVSDGTGAGTASLRSFARIDEAVGLDGTLVFAAATGTQPTPLFHDVEPWSSDGTVAGTRRLVNIASGQLSSNPANLSLAGGAVYFSVNMLGSSALWLTDGTTAGTVMVRDDLLMEWVVEVGGRIMLSGWDISSGIGSELWITDGTPGGTVPLVDIYPGPGSADPRDPTVVGSVVYFSANDGVSGREPWKSDGTPGGTLRVLDITPGPASSYLTHLFAVDPLVVFAVGQTQLWGSDGSQSGTVLLRDFAPSQVNGGTGTFARVDNGAIFSCSDNINGYEPWLTDGATTSMIKVLNGVPGSTTASYPTDLIDRFGTVWMTAANSSGRQVWTSDGSTAQQLSMLGATYVSDLTLVGDTVFFLASGPSIGWTLASHDRWRGVTALGAPTATELTAGRGYLVFRSQGEPWASDGTVAGTVLLADIVPGPISSQPSNFTRVGKNVFFSAADVRGQELWMTDGTAAGTVLVKDINPGTAQGSYPKALAAFDGTLFFSASDGSNGDELWKSDGTLAGTVMVKNIAPASPSSYPRHLTPVTSPQGGALFFTASDLFRGTELWKTDGTTAGTVLVRDIEFGRFSAGPADLVNINGTVIFTAHRTGTGRELWKSDGTASGTTILADIWPGSPGSDPRDLFAVGSRYVFFSADDGQNGRELWLTDGTAAGTRMVADIRVGPASSDPGEFAAAFGELCFVADDGIHGREPWAIDWFLHGTSQAMGYGRALATEDPVSGGNATIYARNAPVGGSGALLIGSPATTPYPFSSELLTVDLAAPFILFSFPIVQREWNFSLGVPPQITFMGARLGFQGLYFSSAGFELTNGVFWQIGR